MAVTLTMTASSRVREKQARAVYLLENLLRSLHNGLGPRPEDWCGETWSFTEVYSATHAEILASLRAAWELQVLAVVAAWTPEAP